MKYISTRGKAEKVSAAEAIVRGLASDGGLYVPQSIVKIDEKSLHEMLEYDYVQLAGFIMGKYLEEFSQEEINEICAEAYSSNFDDAEIVPLVNIGEGEFVMELFHGPTLAFKDMALQVLPRLVSHSLEKLGKKERVLILVATSGDTGKAALEGFSDVEQTNIIVFYPDGGVSPAQKHQMTTQSGDNVEVMAVSGNFDDTQTGVKKIFADDKLIKLVAEKGYSFSSANSMNWGRLLPQIAYYFWAYSRLVKTGTLAFGDKINFSVPTGNFGNILAAYYAKEMGLPINKLVCASNENNVLSSFFETGTYDTNRDFYKTISPSMDILISSNFERLLFEISNRSDRFVVDCMEQLSQNKKYEIPEKMLSNMNELFYAGFATDNEDKTEINRVWKKNKYLLDTHSAIGSKVYSDYRDSSGDNTPAVLVATASPYKFSKDVLSALKSENLGEVDDPYYYPDKLAEFTGSTVPKKLEELKGAEVIFNEICQKDEMGDVVLKTINRWNDGR